jgi:cholesterol oxidase
MFDIEAIVIGSGFGGAVAALRLGQAGIDTILLERGRRWTINDATRDATFATFEKPDGRSTWLSPATRAPGYEGTPIDVYPGVLEVRAEKGITVLTGAGVGGGSLAYAGVLIQPPRELFQQVFPATIDYDELDRVYYPRVRSIMKPAPIPDDILATEYYAAARVTLEQGARAGYPVRESASLFANGSVKVDLNVDWEVVRKEIAGTLVPSAIAGQQWYGNNSGAKQSLDRNYLRLAEATGSVVVRPLHIVTALTEAAGGGYRVSCRVINEAGAVVEEKDLTCKFLFLAAGSMGTSQLLVKAKATGGLPRLNAFTGQGWGNNGDAFMLRGSLPEITNPHQGGPAAGVAILDYHNPVRPALMMPFPSPRFARECPSRNALFTGVFVMSPTRGSFGYEAATDSVTLTFPPDRVAEEAALSLAQTLNKANGGEIMSITSGITAHPLGGACMGQVCDDCGRVNGYAGLYVVDGALMPGSTTCVNPALTIGAIAERAMDHLLAEDIRG